MKLKPERSNFEWHGANHAIFQGHTEYTRRFCLVSGMGSVHTASLTQYTSIWADDENRWMME